MSYDSVMTTNNKGEVQYKMAGLSERITGKKKVAQHFIKHLYGDKVGGLLSTLRRLGWTRSDIVACVMRTVAYIKNKQATQISLHSEEKLVGAEIKKLDILQNNTSVNIEIAIQTMAGTVNITL